MTKMQKQKLLPVIVIAMIGLITALLFVFGNKKEPEVIKYSPYSFSARVFYEEGGYEAAKEAVMKNLPQIYCETNDIVIDGTGYESVLSISGQTYNFNEAIVLGAVFTKSLDESSATKNILNMIIRIPIIDKQSNKNINVVLTNISRTEDGKYTCVSIKGDNSTVAYTNVLRERIDYNANGIVNDAEIKAPLDYGVLEINEEENSYVAIREYAQKKEDERLQAYLIAHENNSSVYFTTTDYAAYPSDVYTTAFDEAKIISDLSNFATGFGLEVIERSELPDKDKKIKKEGWTINNLTYYINEDCMTVQEFFRTKVRDLYALDSRSQLSFEISRNSTTKGEMVTITIFAREGQ